MFRCVVLETDTVNQNRMVTFIQSLPNWQVIEVHAEPLALYQNLIEAKPDLVISHTHLPNLCGLSLANQVRKQISCLWGFVSDKTEMAYQAFDVDALGYLLKPYKQEQLHKLVKKAEQTLMSKSKRHSIIAVKSVGSVKFIHLNDIVWIKGAANYVELHCKSGKYLHRETLTNLEQQLPAGKFLRVHRSAMVNLECVSALTSELGRFSLLKLHNGDEVKVGQGHKNQLFETLGIEG